MNEIKLRYLNVNGIQADSLLAEAVHGLNLHQQKVSALNRLGIYVAENQKPLHAWILAMCRENNFPEVLPAKEIGDAICTSLNPGPRQFMFWLA